MYATLLIWWGINLVLKPAVVPTSRSMFALNLIGYWEGIGTGWFVTLILQLVLVFPLFLFCERRFGLAPVVVVGFALLVTCSLYRSVLSHALGRFGFRYLCR